MPFINGRFYINPQVGAAVERARNNQSDGESGDEVLHHGANHDPKFSDVMVHYYQSHDAVKPVFQPDLDEQNQQSARPRQRSANAQAHQGQQEPAPPQKQQHKAEVGYGETAGLLPQKSPHAPAKASPYDRRTWNPNSAAELQQARTNVMDIFGRNHNMHRARPGKDTISQSVWNDNMHAAAQSDGSLPGKHFFIRQEGVGRQKPDPKQGWGQGKPIHTYGPFRNVGGGDAPKGNHTYIDIYNH